MPKNSHETLKKLKQILAQKPGDERRARQIYQSALEITNKKVQWLYVNGLMEFESKKYSSSASFFSRAIKTDPSYINPKLKLAHVLMKLEKFEEAELLLTSPLTKTSAPYNLIIGDLLLEENRAEVAIKFYDRAIALDSSLASAHEGRAAACLKECRLEDAIMSLNYAIEIQPQNANAFLNRGVTFYRLNLFDQAIENFNQAISLNPLLLAAHSNKATLQARLNKFEDAVCTLEKLIEIDPFNVIALVERGTLLLALNRFSQALKSFDSAIENNHIDSKVYTGRGTVLLKLGRLDEAVQSFDYALDLNPYEENAYANKGAALHRKDNLPEALICLSNAIKINPNHIDSYTNLGNVLFHMRRFDDALTCYDQAISLDHSNGNALFSKSCALLSLKEFKKGFELYSWRWKSELNESNTYLNTTIPLFKKGGRYRSVLIWGDQGIGDVVLFLRFIDKMHDTCESITIACDRRLHELVARSFLGVKVVEKNILNQGSLSEDFDAHTPITDLGYLLNMDELSIRNARNSYLIPNSKITSHNYHPPLGSKKVLKCGIAWRSSASLLGDAKSLSLMDLKPLFNLERLHFVNLQYGDVKRELFDVREQLGVDISEAQDLDLFNDIDGLVALISACDVVVTCSNLTAHLAGALGKKAAVLVPHGRGRIWYWHHDDVKSFWYPSLRIFYQQNVMDWRSAVSDCATWLREFYG